MGRARYELLGEGGGFYGEIPGFEGLLAQANTRESCRDELVSVLEDWVLLGLQLGDQLPVIKGLDLNPQPTYAEAD